MTDRNGPSRPGDPDDPAGKPDRNKGCTAAPLTRPAREVHLAVLAAVAQTGRNELEHFAGPVPPIPPRRWPNWPSVT